MQICQMDQHEGMPNSPLQLNNSASLQFNCLQMLYTHFMQGKPETFRSHQLRTENCLPVLKPKNKENTS